MEKIKIDEIGFNGEGVGRLNGKVCFVRFTLPGEEAEIEITKNKSKFCEVRFVKLLKPSTKRTKPLCPYFSVCGGCDFQHMAYTDELKAKQEILKKQLQKVGINIPIKVNASKKEYFYRNKLKLFFDRGLGFHKAYDSDILPVENCVIAEKEIGNSIAIISNFLERYKHLPSQVEIKLQEGVLLVNFFSKKNINLEIDELSALLPPSQIFLTTPFSTKLLKNASSAPEQDPNVFHQVNSTVASELYHKVVAKAKEKVVINCYSGAGLLSAMLLKGGAKKVFGLEKGLNEHQEAEKLKKQNALDGLVNIQGDCALTLPKVANEAELIIVDPPRAGLSEKVRTSIDSSNAKELVYISCNHATFARDVASLKNFCLSEIEIFDMFPKTANFEIFAHLSRK